MSTAIIILFIVAVLVTVGSFGFAAYIGVSMHRYAARMADDEHRIGAALTLFCLVVGFVGAFTSYQLWTLV